MSACSSLPANRITFFMTPEINTSDLSQDQKNELGEIISQSKRIEDYSVGNHTVVLLERERELFLVEIDINKLGNSKIIFGQHLRKELTAKGVISDGVDIDTHKKLDPSYR